MPSFVVDILLLQWRTGDMRLGLIAIAIGYRRACPSLAGQRGRLLLIGEERLHSEMREASDSEKK